ncbi:MAG: hypothetical protein JW852_08825 [Spirochaetales bacterium]|nr:hypothetical protein [Spirochaetales bacterium]
MKSTLSFLALLFLAAHAYTLDSERIVIQSGHSGPVTRLAVTEDGKSLVSISKDGTLRVWETSSRGLVYRVQISSLPLVELALHPTAPRAAVIESDGINTYRLSVWDWGENRRIFSRNLEVLPLYLSFSAAGSFLAYSVADWQSVTILDSNTGSRPPYLENGFGIVSAFRISTSERRILVYLASGSIQYRDLRSGALVQEYETLPYLEQLSFVSNNRYMIGIWEDTLIAVDLLSGSDVASIRLTNLESYSIDEESGALYALIGPQSEGDSRGIQAVTFNGSSFRTRAGRYVLPDGFSSNHTENGTTMYTGTEFGEIYYQPGFSSTPRLFSQNRLLPVSDFDASESLMIASPSTIMTLYADYLFQPGGMSSDKVITYTQRNPLLAPVSVHHVAGTTYALQATGDPQGRYQLFNPVEGPIGSVENSYQAPIVSFETEDEWILTVDATGKIQLYDLYTNSFVFEMRVQGTKTAIFADGTRIVTAGRPSQTLGASKLLIDTSTGETVPLSDSSIETFLLAYDPLRQVLYSLSIEGTSTKPKTVLTGYSGSTFEREEVLYSAPERVTDASMSLNKGTLVLTTAGVNRVLYTGQDRVMPVDGNDNIPAKVEIIDNWIISLNRDGSLSVWERATGKLALNFYIFENMNWVAVTRDGRVISSSHLTDSYIKTYR